MLVDSLTRRLAAIVSTDVVGYSRLMGEDEEGTLTALRGHRADLIDPKISEHHGRICSEHGVVAEHRTRVVSPHSVEARVERDKLDPVFATHPVNRISRGREVHDRL